MRVYLLPMTLPREGRALDLPDFRRYAAAVAATLVPGDLVALHGAMGAGKTTFVRAVVAALHGSDDAVTSPTFTFRHTYEGQPPIEHLDLYRIKDPREFDEIGIDDAFRPDAIAFVEWPEKLGDRARPTVAIAIHGGGSEPRTVTVIRW